MCVSSSGVSGGEFVDGIRIMSTLLFIIKNKKVPIDLRRRNISNVIGTLN